MEERKLMKLGGTGAVLGGIVCLTPVVVTLLASIGLASWFEAVDGLFHIVMVAGVAALGHGAYRFWKRGTTRTDERTASP